MPLHTNKPELFKDGSVEVAPSAREGEGGTRRIALTRDALVTQPFEGIDTVYDILQYSARTYGAKDALGWRDITAVIEEEKEVKKVVDGKEVIETKTWKYFHLSDYKYYTYVAVREIVSEISRGLVEIGIATDDVFNIYASTCPNWQLMAYACVSISTTIATAYDTLGEAGLTHSLNEPESVGIFTHAELLPTLLKVLAQTPHVKYVIYDGDAKPSLIDDIKAIRDGIRVLSIDEVCELGRAKPVEPLEARRPKPDTLACIMYTGGSTGNPKGVCITHRNLIASIGGLHKLLGHHITYDDTFLAYLPLAHILEYIVELWFFFSGVTSGFGRVKTLTDASVRNCKGDLSAFRPSIMIGVPAVWETIRKGILAKVNAGGTLRKTIFNSALNAKRNNVPILAHVAENYILSGVRAATGGRLRVAMSGGAAVSRETQEFLSLALVTLIQGYGLTESCGMCCILPPEMHRYESVGLPVPCGEVKLLDVPDAGYFASNDPPQGEVCIRGDSVTKGYYKRPDLNNDETIFTKDGWMRTGDIGQWNPDGTLSVIDRLKNLVKLENGEYIALERLESIFKSCNLVGNICVHASQGAKQAIAIVIPHELHLRKAISNPANGLTDIDDNQELAELCKDPRIMALVLKECNAVGKRNGFKPVEMLLAVVLTPDEWTPESGLVTAAQKIQRAKVSRTFEQEIKAAYKA